MLILVILSLALQDAPNASALARPLEPSLANASSNEASACQTLTEEMTQLNHDIVIVTSQKIFLEGALSSTGTDLADERARHILGVLAERLQSHAERLDQSRAALKHSVWPLCRHVQFPAKEAARAHWPDRPD